MLFSLTTYLGKPTIIAGSSGLRVLINESINAPYQAAPGEVRLFGEHQGEYVVFETLGFRDNHAFLAMMAIAWYIDQMCDIEMKLTEHDPRVA